MLYIGKDECCNVSHPYVEWVIDSTTSCHVTSRNEHFTYRKKESLEEWRWAMNNYVDIVKNGDICVETNTGYTLTLKNVWHVLHMRLNLISNHILDKESYGNYFGDGQWRLFRGSLVLARGKFFFETFTLSYKERHIFYCWTLVVFCSSTLLWFSTSFCLFFQVLQFLFMWHVLSQ